jgi:hypothetical protein
MAQLTENQIQSIKRAVGYRGRKVSVQPFKPMSLNSYWNSGSRDYFHFVSPTGTVLRTVPQNGTPFDRLDLKADTLNDGEVLVQTSIYSGKTGPMRIYVKE